MNPTLPCADPRTAGELCLRRLLHPLQSRDEGYITAEEDERADDMYLFIQGSTRVTLDENGFLHAAYKNNAVYMQDQDGLSDIPMT